MKKQVMHNIRKAGKRLSVIGMCILLTGFFTGCEKKEEVPEVSLSLWVDTKNSAIFEDALEEFQELYKDEVKFNFAVTVEKEMSNKETVLADPENAADIYMFADDQLEEMWRAGALLEITENADEIIRAVGGKESAAAQAVMREDKVYAYPLTAGNGYFLYYNKGYFKEDDVKDLNRVLEIAAANKKKFSMDFTSGWYIFSFFKAAGLDLTCNEDGISNSCNWNATDTKYTGVDVVKSMLDIAGHEGFESCNDDLFMEGIENGTIIAGINGAWNAEAIQKSWGENLAVVKLPTYSLKGDKVQMCSFTGYKMMGINAYTKQPQWSMKLAQFLTGEKIQLKRFEEIGECPANENVQNQENVQSSPFVLALQQQEPYAYIQNVADPFWDASCVLGTVIASKNENHRDLQELLDDAVAGITAEPKEEE